jgi:general secretion pathway protein D
MIDQFRRALPAYMLPLLLAGCASQSPVVESPLTIAPASPSPSGNAVLGYTQKAPQANISTIIGSGEFTKSAAKSTRTAVEDGEPVDINFVNAEIRATLDAVLGGMLGLNYTLDPKVQGQITIRTTRPLPRSQALAAVDAVLREQGFSIVASNGFYQVIPSADAIGMAPFRGAAEAERAAGFTTAIVPVRYVSAVELDKVVKPLTRQGFVLQSDGNRNIFIVSGTAREIDSFTKLIDSLDVNWLAGLSFSLHSLSHVEPNKIEAELRRALQLDTGPMKGVVELIPIPRLNALLVATKQFDLLSDIDDWIRRLDQAGPDGGRLVHYYEVQNGSAAELAATLGKLTGARTEGASSAPRQERRQTSSGMSAAGSSMGSVTAGAPGGMFNGAGATSPTSPLVSAAPSSSGDNESGDGEGIAELKGVRVVADDRRNALLIFGTGTQYAIIEDALARLDSPREQVLIEATIAEVTLTDQLNFGVQWFLDRGSSRGGYTSAAPPPTSTFPGFNYSFLTQNTQVVLSALSGITNVQVLSAPRLMVINNESARLQVGDEVPIVVQQATSLITTQAALVNSVQYQDTGVILEVTPHINRSGTVVLDVSQEVSSVATTTSSGIDSPTIQQRKISSIVTVQDGETVALGGLISDTTNRTGQGIPFLRDIPLLGNLFGTEGNSKNRTELLVFLRPVIVRDVARARDVTEALKARMSRLEALTRGSNAP